MSISEPTPQECAAAAIRDSIRRAAEVYGGTITHEPIEGFHLLTRAVLDDPLTGVQAARLARDVAVRELQRYAEEARGAGRSWDDIAAALGIEPAEDGEPRDELAYLLIVEHRPLPGAEEPRRWRRSVARWTCGSCGKWISDSGPFESRPDDAEDGHAPECGRRT